MDVASRLRDLGLADYAHVDAEGLPRLTADDLTTLGVTSVGHCRRLRDAIATFEQERAPAAAEASIGLDPDRTAPRRLIRAGTDAIEVTFSFETAQGKDIGIPP